MADGSSFCFSSFTPSAFKQFMVDTQSLPGDRFLILLLPSAKLLKMRARCEIDLSPGTAISPINCLGDEIIFSSVFPAISVSPHWQGLGPPLFHQSHQLSSYVVFAARQ